MGKKKKKREEKIERVSLGTKNYAFLGAGILSIIVGYITLAMGSITLAPILLVLGYAVFVPLGLMLK
ncbi:hypothetical protein DRQ17_04955 [bacterium]|nr:MAG: hypothetical protein DRQ17_04955 [bacterium]